MYKKIRKKEKEERLLFFSGIKYMRARSLSLSFPPLLFFLSLSRLILRFFNCSTEERLHTHTHILLRIKTYILSFSLQ